MSVFQRLDKARLRKPQVFILIVILLVLGTACTSSVNPDKPTLSALATGTTYTVRQGDTLYAIARHYGKSIQEIAHLNNLLPPYKIYPGQVLTIQENTASCPQCKQLHRDYSNSPAVTVKPDNTQQCQASHTWQWPTQGRLAKYDTRIIPNGITLLGQVGQAIKATAAGIVVDGGRLKNSYPNLIMIQHDDAFSSLYVYTRYNRVKIGDRVAQGQTIAQMGTDVHRQPMLYFEIRCHHKPINPLAYLP